jgi:hypothetical protein
MKKKGQKTAKKGVFLGVLDPSLPREGAPYLGSKVEKRSDPPRNFTQLPSPLPS